MVPAAGETGGRLSGIHGQNANQILREYLERKKSVEVAEGERGFLRLIADLLKVYRAYEKYRRDEMVIYFEDMDHGAVNLLKANASVRSACRSRFRHIMVDEFQDTNFPSWSSSRNSPGRTSAWSGTIL